MITCKCCTDGLVKEGWCAKICRIHVIGRLSSVGGSSNSCEQQHNMYVAQITCYNTSDNNVYRPASTLTKLTIASYLCWYINGLLYCAIAARPLKVFVCHAKNQVLHWLRSRTGCNNTDINSTLIFSFPRDVDAWNADLSPQYAQTLACTRPRSLQRTSQCPHGAILEEAIPPF